MEIEIPESKDVTTRDLTGKPKPRIETYKKGNNIDLTFKDLRYTVKVKDTDDKGKQRVINREILKGISGIAKSGEVCAIMGASGAGKTSLLNILSCQIRNSGNASIEGEILANGKSFNSQMFSKFAGYVMQTDVLMETMTPRECLTFAANLRLNSSPAEKQKFVENLLKELKLQRAADTYVGGALVKGISGGERKRASIGVELISDPSMLFLDEPTSGLDSFTAFVIINLLKNKAAQGKTIVFTIHQPSSDIFEMFDTYMVLCKGKFIYQGRGDETVDYFDSIGFKCPDYSNPADFIMDLAHADSAHSDKFETLFNKYDETLKPAILDSIARANTEEIVITQKESRFWYEFKIVTQRAFRNYGRNPVLFRAGFGQTLFFAFLTCCLFFQLSDDPNNSTAVSNREGCLYFLTIAQFFAAMSTALLTFPVERALFLKEQGANMYSVSAYFFGRSLTELPQLLIFPLLFPLIVYWIIGFNNYSAAKFFIFVSFMMLQSSAGNAVGLLAGCMFSDPRVANGVAPMAIMPLLIFAGFYINSSQMPVWLAWIRYISPFYYALQGLIENEFYDSPFGSGPVYQLSYNIPLGLCAVFHIVLSLGWRLLALANLKILVKRLQ